MDKEMGADLIPPDADFEDGYQAWLDKLRTEEFLAAMDLELGDGKNGTEARPELSNFPYKRGDLYGRNGGSEDEGA